MDEALRALIEFLETASPAIWAAAQQQVLAESNMLWAWIGVIGSLFALSLAGAIITARDRYDDGSGPAVCGVVAAILLIVLVAISTRQYGMHSNPLWYAILKLRYLLPK